MPRGRAFANWIYRQLVPWQNVGLWPTYFPCPTLDLHLTTYMGISSAVGQRTRSTQPFSLSGSINWVVSCNRMSALVTSSGECLRGEDLVWLIEWCVR